MKHFLPVLIVLLIMVSCNQPTVDLKAEEAAIMKTDSTWAAQAKEMKDVDKSVSYWADDAVVLPPGQPAVRGKEALHKMVADSKNIPGFSISWRSSDVHFSPDGKMAYMYGENLVTMNDSTGKTMNIPGRSYTVWSKQANGEWKCVVDTWNNPSAQ
jgi:ketosteroid isomerase-like protein